MLILLFPPNPTAPYSASCAPSILITFIDMVLFNTPKPPPEGCHVYMFSGQHFFQIVFVIVALACIPVMLLGKPLQIMKQRKQSNVSKLINYLQQNINYVQTSDVIPHLALHLPLHHLKCMQNIMTYP